MLSTGDHQHPAGDDDAVGDHDDDENLQWMNYLMMTIQFAEGLNVLPLEEPEKPIACVASSKKMKT